MIAPPLRPALVIFDCDGVLVDSEPASDRVMRAEAARLGIALDEAALAAMTGLRWSDVAPRFEALGAALPPDWPLAMQDTVIAEMRDHGLAAIPGARDAIEAVAGLGISYRVASNSSHEEMDVKFGLTGLAPLVDGRLHSARDVGRGKPAPDLFLRAAASAGVPAPACLVIEDSAPGIEAARRAGMEVFAYAPSGRAPIGGVAVLRHMAALGPLLASRPERYAA